MKNVPFCLTDGTAWIFGLLGQSASDASKTLCWHSEVLEVNGEEDTYDQIMGPLLLWVINHLLTVVPAKAHRTHPTGNPIWSTNSRLVQHIWVIIQGTSTLLVSSIIPTYDMQRNPR